MTFKLRLFQYCVKMLIYLNSFGEVTARKILKKKSNDALK